MADALNILVLEDSRADFLLIERQLKQSGLGAHCTHVDNLEALEQALERGGWDAVLSDYSIPQMNFLDSLALIQARRPDTPVVLVSGSIGEENAVELLKLGVWDFILKDRLSRLAPSLERSLRDGAERRARRTAETALRESEARYRALVEITCDWIWEIDARGYYTYVSPKVYDILGLTPEEVLGRTPFDLMPPDEARRVQAIFGGIAAARRPFSALQNVNRHKDGRLVVLETSGVPVFGPDGAFLGYRGMDRDITARQNAEQALLENEERYRRLFEEAIEGIVLADAETGTILDCNQAFLHFTGYGKEDLIGRSQTMLHPPEAGDPPVSGTFALHRDGQGGEVLEAQLATHSGRIKEVEIKANVLEIGGRKLLQGFFHDVTEERRGQREREVTLALLRQLNDRTQLHELAQTVLEMVQRWTGCEAVGMRLREGDDFPYYETRGFADEFARRANHLCRKDAGGQIVRDAGGGPLLECMCGKVLCGQFTDALPFFTARGSFWTNSTSELQAEALAGEPQARPCGRCNGEGYESVALIPLRQGAQILGLLQLIDRVKGRFTPETIAFLEQLGDQIAVAIAQRQAEDALRASEEKFRRLVEGLQNEYFFYQRDREGVFTYLSPSVTNVLGYIPEERKVHFSEMRTDAPCNQDALHYTRQGLNGVAQPPYEVEVRHRDGSNRQLEVFEVPLLDRDGRVQAVDGIAHDVTERKRAEAERRKLEAQLNQSQKMEAIGQLAGGVAHDFNNLLTIILGYSNMLLTELPRHDPNRSCVADIYAAGERAASLTRQLLAFSRKQVLEPKVLSLNDVMSDIEKMLRRLIGEDIVLTTILSPEASRVRVDPGQMEQVVINLAVNARDAMPQGGRLIIETRACELDDDFYRLHPERRPGRYTLLTVTDTGKGMTPEIQARIFEPFFTTKEMGKGTGLGLATVFGIIKQSDGYIDVCSEVGVGTCFKIYLPAIAAETTPALPGQEAGDRLQGKETILLVEDEETVRRIVGRVLATQGYEVHEAENGQAALALVATLARPCQLLITDVVMPEMSGRELANKLQGRLAGLKVLFMSGYTDDAIVRHGLVDAKVAYLSKPFSPLALARKVREVLDQKA